MILDVYLWGIIPSLRTFRVSFCIKHGLNYNMYYILGVSTYEVHIDTYEIVILFKSFIDLSLYRH
jgi:hypothetical protein